MVIFTNRFLKEMMKYKKHTNDLKENNYEEIPRLNEEEMKSLAHKSIGYLTCIFLNIVGGFFYLVSYYFIHYYNIQHYFILCPYTSNTSSGFYIFIIFICCTYNSFIWIENIYYRMD
jgi:hypothetical protein